MLVLAPLLSAILVFVPAAAAAAAASEEDGEEASEAPSLEDQQKTAGTLLERLSIYINLMPHAVDEALASLTAPQTVEFPCAKAPLPKEESSLNDGGEKNDKGRALPAQNVKIIVKTSVGGWDAAAAQDAGRAGHYSWNFGEAGWDADGKRAPDEANNTMMFNPSSTEARGLKGHADNVVLAYHELLHGQLMLEAMKSDVGWQALYCKMFLTPKENTELYKPVDAEHAVIGPLEEKFSSALWEEVTRRADDKKDDPWAPYRKKDK